MKPIEKLRNKFKGREIWIVGAGPSLDDFPDDFFDPKDKISIALKFVLVAFPNCRFYFSSYRETYFTNYISWKRQNLLKKCIWALEPKDKPHWSKRFRDDPYFVREEKSVFRPREFLEKMARDIVKGKSRAIATLKTGTTSELAISVAVILGAKKITLVGCEHKEAPDGRCHAQKRGLWVIYPVDREKQLFSEYRKGGGKKLNPTLRTMAEIYKPHGIEIMRYFFNRGYEKII